MDTRGNFYLGKLFDPEAGKLSDQPLLYDPADLTTHAVVVGMTGSGKTGGRHRLNRGGNRQANAALYRAVIVRMRWHAPTIAYVERRTADGLSKKDIIRCLKRFLARELFHLLPAVSSAQAPAPIARAAYNDLTIYRSINAVAESFFGTLQLELLDRHHWTSRDQLASAIFEWIEIFYNPQRRHSSVGMLSPVDYETAHAA